jgi:hypothetical protein
MNRIFAQSKTPFFPFLLILFVLQLSACNDNSLPKPADSYTQIDTLVTPIPVDSLEQPNDADPTPPIDSTTIDPIQVFGRFRMQWAPTDYRDIYYDAAQSPIRTIRENLYVQNTDITRKEEITFLYNENKQLTQTRSSNGTYVNYFYKGNQVQKTEEFASDGFLLATRNYHFEGNKLLKVLEINHYGKGETETRYYYGTWGNLTEARTYAKNPETQAFDTYTAVHYSKYDTQKNRENLWMIYPYLPSTEFSQNNFGEVSFFAFDGKELTEVSQRKLFSYAYNQEGYPTQRVQIGNGFTLTANYSYTGL